MARGHCGIPSGETSLCNSSWRVAQAQTSCCLCAELGLPRAGTEPWERVDPARPLHPRRLSGQPLPSSHSLSRGWWMLVRACTFSLLLPWAFGSGASWWCLGSRMHLWQPGDFKGGGQTRHSLCQSLVVGWGSEVVVIGSRLGRHSFKASSSRVFSSHLFCMVVTAAPNSPLGVMGVSKVW